MAHDIAKKHDDFAAYLIHEDDNPEFLPFLTEFLSVSPDAYLVMQDNRIVYYAGRALQILGVTAEVLGQITFVDFFGRAGRKEVCRAQKQAIETQTVQTIHHLPFERSARGRLIELRHLTIHVSCVDWRGTPALQYIVQDVTTEYRQYRQLYHAAYLDSLTLTQNRRSFIHYADKLKQDQKGRRFGIILFDVDFYKRINELNGSVAGDEILRQVAMIAEKHVVRHNMSSADVMSTGMLARLGGDTFGIIIPGLESDALMQFAEGLRFSLSFRYLEVFDQAVSVTVSLGLAQGCLGVESVDDVLQIADSALYQAKKSGRNRSIMLDSLGVLPPVGMRISRMHSREERPGYLRY